MTFAVPYIFRELNFQVKLFLALKLLTVSNTVNIKIVSSGINSICSHSNRRNYNDLSFINMPANFYCQTFPHNSIRDLRSMKDIQNFTTEESG